MSTEHLKKPEHKTVREKKPASQVTFLMQSDSDRRRELLKKYKIPRIPGSVDKRKRSHSQEAALGSEAAQQKVSKGASANPDEDEEPTGTKEIGIVNAEGSTVRKYVVLKKGLKIVLYHSNALIASKITKTLEKTDREGFIRHMVRNTWHAKHKQQHTLLRPTKAELDEVSLHLCTEYDILRDTNKLEGERFYETLAFDMNRRLTNECYELGKKGLLVPKLVYDEATTSEQEEIEETQKIHEKKKGRSSSIENLSMNVLCFIIFLS